MGSNIGVINLHYIFHIKNINFFLSYCATNIFIARTDTY